VKARVAALLAAVVALAGCEKAARNMYEGARTHPLATSDRFPDGMASRGAVEGTEEHGRGVLAETSSGRKGADETQRREAEDAAASMPYPMTMSLLARGQQRFQVYCSPCHGMLGDGDGMVVRRGFPRPPSYHIDRLRAAPDRHIYEVIRDGYGVMYPFGDRVEPADRWAIVAYVRALQRSQSANAADVPTGVALR
jgi:mono/diheme cytochrome c family protein